MLNRHVDLHAIDASPARWRGDAGSLFLDVHPTHWLISTQVLYLPNIRPEKLGAASLIAVHRLVAGLPLHDARLYSRDETRSRRWDHKAPFVGSRRRHQNGEEPAFWRASKYVYYTESDQILRIRSSKALAAMALGADPAAALLVPHRGVPLPTPEDFNGGAILATEELRFNGGWGAAPLDAARDACCFPSDSHACLHTHVQSREDLRASTKLLRAAGALSLIPGEGNFLRMEYRACVHAPDGGGRACA